MPDPRAIIEAMLRPSFYPHATNATIDHVQTHSAHVFLTGPFAYKVKKPVDLGFLDFSTREKRRYYCDEEVRLNRQFGASMYRGTCAIVPRDGGFALSSGDDATAVEYAVQMDQFDRGNVLLALLDRGELTDARVVDLARKTAAMHANALTGPAVARYGSADAVYRAAAENIEGVRPFVGRTETAARFAIAQDFVLGFIDRHRALIDRRAETGRVRECHGDLHLNNICLHGGRLEFFDCIDFNEAFRNIDVMYELAFLAMDLEYRGAAEQANLLVNAYIEESGDYEGAALLPMYMHMRAYVRGKVSSILLDEPEIVPEQRRHAAESAENHFAYAARIPSRNRTMLIVMCGLSGSGKSTVARELARRLGAIHIRTDAVRKHLCGVGLRDRSDTIYTAAITEATYTRLDTLATLLLTDGLPVILDGTYAREEDRARALACAAHLRVPARIVHCTAPHWTLAERLRQRQGDVSDATGALIETQAERFEPLTAEERLLRIEVATDSGWNAGDLVGRIRAALALGP